MQPQTPKSHSKRPSILSTPGTPATPPSGYVLAQETPTRGPERGAQTDEELDSQLGNLDSGLDLSPSTASGSVSVNDESMLEILDMEEDEDEEMLFSEGDDEDEDGFDAGEPLVSRGRKRRRRWDQDEQKDERSLIELVPPLILAHPLPLFPLLALLPYNFLPAGVVFFIPIICVLAILSSCAHIVIIYLAWYLKVPSFEEVFASVTGKYGGGGLWAGRAAVIIAATGVLVGWLGTIHPLLSPVIDTYLPRNGFLSSRILWTIIPAISLLPSLLPSRMTRSLRRAPILLALLLPIVAFLVIGRTVEIQKSLQDEIPPLGGELSVVEVANAVASPSKRGFGLAGGSSAGAGLTTLTVFLSPHLNTLPLHASLSRNKRSSFPVPCLTTSTLILVLSLPLALVPYYLLPSLDDSLPQATPTTPSGVFARLPADDAWVNIARVLMSALALGSCNMWILRARDTVLRAMGVDRGERQKAGRWLGLGIWAAVVSLACIGGWLAEKVELLGVIATLAVGWLLPSLFFIISFHVRSPLAIVFPSTASKSATDGEELPPAPARSLRHPNEHADTLNDPSTDAVLARKERQLQKRRLGRRLWQDLIVYVGILPVGCITLAWTLGALIGIW
ncbi:MAG: hypothetical protein TREMPRED_003587 [Tremellales sp. Tagirdzhanova-0007]|nr:MAG: hypothetical protein TREMPRED_003587 [Tremellales sp. Tagirdzhanova-0007]